MFPVCVSRVTISISRVAPFLPRSRRTRERSQENAKCQSARGNEGLTDARCREGTEAFARICKHFRPPFPRRFETLFSHIFIACSISIEIVIIDEETSDIVRRKGYDFFWKIAKIIYPDKLYRDKHFHRREIGRKDYLQVRNNRKIKLIFSPLCRFRPEEGGLSPRLEEIRFTMNFSIGQFPAAANMRFVPGIRDFFPSAPTPSLFLSPRFGHSRFSPSSRSLKLILMGIFMAVGERWSPREYHW